MRKLILSALTVLCFVVAAFAQKKVYDENADVRITGKDFHAIKISGGIDLYLSEGNETSVVASAREIKYRDRIKTEINDGVLRIWYDSEGNVFKWNTGDRRLKVYVSYKSLDKINASGSSYVHIEGTLKAENLDIDLSGASDLKGTIVAKKLNVQQSGASDVKINGSATELYVKAGGASDFKGFDFVVETCEARAGGASDVQITVNKELNAHASGASDIQYKGTAMIKDLHTSGASSVKKRG